MNNAFFFNHSFSQQQKSRGTHKTLDHTEQTVPFCQIQRGDTGGDGEKPHVCVCSFSTASSSRWFLAQSGHYWARSDFTMGYEQIKIKDKRRGG